MRVKEGGGRNKKKKKKDIPQTKFVASGLINSRKIEEGESGRKSGSHDRFYLLGLQNHFRWLLQL